MVSPEPISNHVSVWGEGPIWHNGPPALRRYRGAQDHRLHAGHGEEKIWDVGQRVGTVVPRASGGLVWAGDNGFFFLDESTGVSARPSPILSPNCHDNRFNDGKCDPAGRFWAGTINLKKQPTAALYCLHTDLWCRKEILPRHQLQRHHLEPRHAHDVLHRHAEQKDPRLRLRQRTSAISNERVVWDTSADPPCPTA
jgi:sugar lactone lactonase YvrE